MYTMSQLVTWNILPPTEMNTSTRSRRLTEALFGETFLYDTLTLKHHSVIHGDIFDLIFFIHPSICPRL